MSTTRKNQGKQKVNVLYMVELGLLIGIILLMSFTPIGYIPIGPGLTITLIPIPVVIGAITLGPSAGAILGAVFGLTSFSMCLLGRDAFGVALLEISPYKTFFLCLIPRILMGLLCALIFKAIYKTKLKTVVPFAISSLMGPLLNTVFFMSSLWFLFKDAKPVVGMANSIGSTGFWSFIIGFIGINALVEASVCLVVGTAVSKGIYSYVLKLNRQNR